MSAVDARASSVEATKMISRVLKTTVSLLAAAISIAIVVGLVREARYRADMPLAETVGQNEDRVMAGAIGHDQCHPRRAHPGWIAGP